MNVLMIAAEMSPLVKVGGLADVTGSLPAALAARGHDVRVVLPRYADLEEAELATPAPGMPASIPLRLGQRMMTARFSTWLNAPAGVTVYLVELPGLYDRPGIYTDAAGDVFDDALERSGALCQAALAVPELAGWPVDIVHAHDTQAALAPIMRRQWYGSSLPGAGRTLLTIHNLAHQDIVDPKGLVRVGLDPELAAYPGPLEFFGQANLFKGGILAADVVNTVSPTYAREVVDDPVLGCGLEGVLAGRGADFSGILNGVDYSVWNPATDPLLPARYGPDDPGGKQACRDHLLAEVGLIPLMGPLFGFVGRLVSQKGLDLMVPLIDRLIARGAGLVVLGTGAAEYHEALETAVARHPGRVAFSAEFNESRAHAIYAGSDLFLMPSRFEPCGLSQLYAMRYGTPPVVRRTGGLADTVVDATAAGGTGFVFDDPDPEALWSAIEQALVMHADSSRWSALLQRAMTCDFSWDAAAEKYEACYRTAAARRAASKDDNDAA